MTEAQPADLIGLRRESADRCGCGPDNTRDLQLDGFEGGGDTARTAFAPSSEYHGFSGTLYGGFVATALDQIIA